MRTCWLSFDVSYDGPEALPPDCWAGLLVGTAGRGDEPKK